MAPFQTRRRAPDVTGRPTKHSAARRRSTRPAACRPLVLQALEDRKLLSCFVVTNTADSGPGSLRQAIIDTNNNTFNSGVDSINFNIVGLDVQKIQPLSQLPIITHPVFIDGYSQPGSMPNDLAQGDDAILLIELDGSLAGPYRTVSNSSAGNSTVRGLDINRFGSAGVFLDDGGSAFSTIQGDFIGTDPTGEQALGNGYGVGFYNSNYGLVGTDGDGVNDLAERNVISGNRGTGIGISASFCVVAGDYIGTDAKGTIALGNAGHGIDIRPRHPPRPTANRVGVDGQHLGTSAERNIISGNAGGGVVIEVGGENVVAGNFIGTDVTGTQPLGNGGDGVVDQSLGGNIIGTDGDGVGDAFEANVISANAAKGVDLSTNNDLVAGNMIGTNAAGTRIVGSQDTGVFIFTGTGNTIGGLGTGDGNLISGNNTGIDCRGSGNLVQGNYIGNDASHSPFLGNGDGIVLSAGSGNTIGGAPPCAGNLISSNGRYGVWIGKSSGSMGNLVQGNRVEFNRVAGVEIDSGSQSNTIGGTSAGAATSLMETTGKHSRRRWRGGRRATTTTNAIRGNSIGGNGGLGIDLGGDGATPNTTAGPHTGPNGLQNFPVLTAASPDSTEVKGTLNAMPCTPFAVDFYTSGILGSYLGSATVTTDSSGNATFDVSGLGATTRGVTITATATDPNGNTSEFSQSIVASAATTITLTSSSSLWTYGQTQITLGVAAVNPDDGTPSGTVQLIVDGVNFGTPIGGDIGPPFTLLPAIGVGPHTITAVYSGFFGFDPSTSPSLALTVTSGAPTISAADQTKEYGASITFAGTEFTTTGLAYGDSVTSVALTSLGARRRPSWLALPTP